MTCLLPNRIKPLATGRPILPPRAIKRDTAAADFDCRFDKCLHDCQNPIIRGLVLDPNKSRLPVLCHRSYTLPSPQVADQSPK
jgi:hypothetical protein